MRFRTTSLARSARARAIPRRAPIAPRARGERLLKRKGDASERQRGKRDVVVLTRRRVGHRPELSQPRAAPRLVNAYPAAIGLASERSVLGSCWFARVGNSSRGGSHPFPISGSSGAVIRHRPGGAGHSLALLASSVAPGWTRRICRRPRILSGSRSHEKWLARSPRVGGGQHRSCHRRRGRRNRRASQLLHFV